MRDPDSLIQIDYHNDKVTVLPINHLPEFDIEDYDLLNDKDFNKYIIQIKKTVRNSFEYKQWVTFLREHMDMNKCSYYANVNNIDTYKIKIHVHHDPFTLEDIIRIVFNKRNTLGESLAFEMIAKEVMFLHYNLLVGVLPLAETVHELVHNQYLFVPTSIVYGNYKDFVNMYYDYITPDQLGVLEKIESYTYQYDNNMSVLEKNFIYVDHTGAYKLPKYEDIIVSMQKRIDETKMLSNNKPMIKPVTWHTKD